MKNEITHDNYHSNYEYVSKSALDVFSKSELHYYHMINGAEREKTKTLIYGGYFHMLLLQPELIDSHYYVGSVDRRTTEGKKKALEIEEAGLEIISIQDSEHALGMRDSILNHSEAKKLLNAKYGFAERIFTGLDELTNIKLKCRPDWYNTFFKCIVDLKTTDDASIRDFSRSVMNYKYYLQSAFYSDLLRKNGVEVSQFYFIAVEKKPPYPVAVYTLSEDYIQYGRDEYRRLLKELADFRETGKPKGYNDNTIMDIQIPNYLNNNY